MKALMSDKLRKILRDPKSRKALEEGVSKLNNNNSEKISIAGHKYEIKFVQIDPNEKK